LAFDAKRPGSGFGQACDYPQQSAFPTTAWTKERHDLASRNREVQSIEDRLLVAAIGKDHLKSLTLDRSLGHWKWLGNWVRDPRVSVGNYCGNYSDHVKFVQALESATSLCQPGQSRQ
ncbi:MAG: hypothetical protein RLZZ396_1391, partial [Planctomycetota bacterium]